MSRALLRFCVARNIRYCQHLPAVNSTLNSHELHGQSAQQNVAFHRTHHKSSSSSRLVNNSTSNCFSRTQDVDLQCQRLYATSTTVTQDSKPGIVKRLLGSLGLGGKLKFKKAHMQVAALRLYLCCVEQVDYDQFFEEFDLPDTFVSWFKITELHIWLLMVRLAQEGDEGFFVRQQLITNMWQDIDKRARELGPSKVIALKHDIYRLSDMFRGSIVSYDEGILGDDKILACCVWRVFLSMKSSDPEKVELLVQYIRKQLVHLDEQASDMILLSGLLTYLPLHGDQLDEDRTFAALQFIQTRT